MDEKQYELLSYNRITFHSLMKRFSIALILLGNLSYFTCFSQQPCTDSDAGRNSFAKAQKLDESSNFSQSAPLYEKASKIFEKCNDWENYSVATYQWGLALLNIDSVFKAVQVFENLKSKSLEKLGSNTQVYALACHNLGEIYFRIEKPVLSIENFELALKSLTTIYGQASQEVALCLYNMGNALEMNNQLAEAIAKHKAALEIKKSLNIADSASTLDAYSTLGKLYQESGKTDSANYYFNLAQGFSTLKSVDDIKNLSYLKFKSGRLLYDDGKYAQAQQAFTEAKVLSHQVNDTLTEAYASVLLYLGLIYEKSERYDSAYILVQRSFNLLKKINLPYNKTYFNTLLTYADVSIKIGKLAEAINLYNEALVVAKTKFQDATAFTAEIYISLGKTYETLSDNANAESNYNQALLAIKGDSIGFAEQFTNSLLGLASIKYEQNNITAAKAIYSRLEAQVLSGKITNPDIVADIYNALGNLYLKQTDYDRAKNYYNKAYQKLSETYGTDNLKVLSINENIANVYNLQGDFAKSIEIFEKNLEFKIRKLGKNHPDVAELYNNLGNAYYESGDVEKAGKQYEEALAIRLALGSSQKSKLDGLYNNIGLYYKAAGNYSKSLEYFTLSKKLKNEQFGAENIQSANVLNNMGTIYEKLGLFDKAMAYFDSASIIITRMQGDSALDLSNVCINKGNLYNRMGQNDLALEYYNKSLVLKIKYLGQEHPQLSSIYNNIGTIYQNQEDYKSAYSYFEKSLNIRQKTKGGNNPETAESLINIGNIYLKTGDVKKALERYFGAVTIYKKTYSNNHILTGNANNNIAMAFFTDNNPDSALYYFTMAVGIYKSIFGDKHPTLSLVYNNIGDLYVKKCNYLQALQYYQLSLSANHRAFSSSAPLSDLPSKDGYFDQSIFLKSALSKASAFTQKYIHTDSIAKDRNDLKLALRHFYLCDTIVSNMRKFAITKSDKIALGETALRCYEGAIEVCTELSNFETNADTSLGYRTLAFNFAEKSKANALLEAIAGQDAMQLSSVPDSLKLTEKTLSAEIAQLEKQLAERPKDESKIRDKLFDCNRRYNSLIKNLEQKYPDYFNLKYSGKTVSLKELQSVIALSEQVRIYLIGFSYLFILNVTKNDIVINTQPLVVGLSDTVKKYRDCITLYTNVKYMRIYRDLSNYMYKYLLPDNPDTSVIKSIVVIPDGKISQVPFESLLYQQYIGSVFEYTEYPYLIRKFNISYAYSSSLLYRTISNQTASFSQGYRWLGLAPVFTNTRAKSTVYDNRDFRRDYNEYPDNADKAVRNGAIDELPSTEDELKEIYNLFDSNGQRAKALLYESARKKFVLSDSIKKYNIIHFATHGFVDADHPELSGIQLCITDNSKGSGILYSGEIYNLNLKAGLVVLSACETGLGKITKGEGIVGLSRAFFYAGANNLVVSLWKVSDASTSMLMIDFYKNLLQNHSSKTSLSADLRLAKLKLIENKKFAKPYYWSPFILLGE
jgi:tetratricopeptide (TPR) repeat protein